MKFLKLKEFNKHTKQWIGDIYKEKLIFKYKRLFIYKCEYLEPEYYKFIKIIWN